MTLDRFVAKPAMTYRRVGLMLAVLFCLFIASASLLFTKAREEALQNALQQGFQLEYHLLVSLLSEPLLRCDYVQVRKTLSDYFNQNPDYAAVALTAPNGFSIFSATRPFPAGESFREVRQVVMVEKATQGILELKKKDQVKAAWWLDSTGLIAVVIGLPLLVLALLVWMIVKRLGLDPLRSEAESQSASYEALFEQSKEAILVLSGAGWIEKVNPEARRLFRLSEEQLPVQLESFHTAESFLQVEQFLDKVREDGFHREVVYLAAKDLYLDIVASRMEVGGEHKIQLLIHDVSPIHRSQRELETLRDELKHSLKTYQDLFNSSGDGLVVRDLNGILIMANQAFLTMLGYEVKDLVGTHCAEICKAKDCDNFEEVLKGQPVVFQALHRAKSGEEIPVEVNSALISFKGQRAVLSSVRDLRERLEREERLQQLLAVVENSNDGVLVTDADGTIIAVNRAFCTISGYEEREVLGKNPRLFQSGVHDQAFYRSMWKELKQRGGWQGEVWNRNKEGKVYPEMLTIRSLRDATGKVNRYVGIFTDLSNEKALEEKVLHLAQTDPLTGMANRVLFRDRLQQAIKHAERHQSTVTVCSLGLDRFKKINDSLGHETGDQILIEVAQRLKRCVREEDSFCRLSGDEFALMICCGEESVDIATVANKILQAIRLPIVIDDKEHFLTASMGIALFPKDSGNDLGLMQKAESAMHQAKERGRDRYCYFSREFSEQAEESLRLTNLLHKALENRELQLHYQPQVELATGRIVAAEALLRWQSSDLGWVSPARMIPVAEESGLILPIGLWVLEQAAGQVRSHYDASGEWIPIAVNVSVKQFMAEDFVDLVQTVVDRQAIPANCLELELTESLMLTDVDQAVSIMERLHELGVTLALDDFGTGYTSLAYLKRFPVDKIKLDRAFVTDVHCSRSDAALAKSLVAFTSVMDFELVAEGIEEEIQTEALNEMGFRFGQGYLYSRPLPEAEFSALLLAKTTLPVPSASAGAAS
ncbi:MAG: EAL domain-containing protein [Desulfuromonadaceae bacterium]|nr:EAL domain-containing protein [Desulfuromonadaceae bacterium]